MDSHGNNFSTTSFHSSASSYPFIQIRTFIWPSAQDPEPLGSFSFWAIRGRFYILSLMDHRVLQMLRAISLIITGLLTHHRFITGELRMPSSLLFTHQPTWDDCQQLLQVLFTTEEQNILFQRFAKMSQTLQESQPQIKPILMIIFPIGGPIRITTQLQVRSIS